MIEYRLRIRNRANTADAIVITSVRGDAKPYFVAPPTGEGYRFDPLTGRSRAGVMRLQVADAIHSYDGATPLRVLTQELEDETQRWALPARLAFLEKRHDGGAWDTYHPGVLSQHTLAGGLVWDLAITDVALVTRKTLAFAPRRHSDPDLAAQGRLEPIADYLARWPRRGCILGGPVRGGVLSAPDLGGWRMTVQQRNSNVGGNTWLKFVEGYGTPTFAWTRKPQDLWAAIDQAAGRVRTPNGHYSSLSELTTVDQAEVQPFPRIVTEVMRNGGATVNYMRNAWRGASYDGLLDEFFNAGSRNPGLFLDDHDEVLPLGAACRVRAFEILPSEVSPIYWTGHAVDLAALLLDETDEVYHAASKETVRDAIGRRRYLTVRITETQDRQQFLENVLYGPFGFAVRPHAAGGVEFFSTRIFANSAPVVELTASSIPRGEDGGFSGTTFDVETATAISQVVLEHDRLAPVQLLPEDQRAAATDTPTDGVRVDQNVRLERTNGDPGQVPGDTVEFKIPGMVHLADATAPDTNGFVDALALEVFDRWGRGIQASEHEIRFDDPAADEPLGAEILNALPQLPNHNRRLGDDASVAARAQQIVQRSIGTRGVHVRLLDSGPNAQPVPTLPVLALAASATFPRTVAELTITNAATLNAAGYGAQVLMAATAGAPAAEDYAQVLAYAPGQIPTTAIALPAVAAGRTVYARARSTEPQLRPSNYSAAVLLALEVIAPVTGLTATPEATDGSRATIRWALPDTEPHVVDVTYRLTADAASEAKRLPVLPPDSTQATLEELTQGASYTATVVRRDAVTGDVSAAVEIAFTAAAATGSLNIPDEPTGYSTTDGTYGIAVDATEFAGFVEWAEAVETAVGSDAYGAYATVGSVPIVLDDWTRCQNHAPNDGLRRKLKARQVRDGATASDYTAEVIVTPWTTEMLPPFPSQDGIYDVKAERISATIVRITWQRRQQAAYVFAHVNTLPTGYSFPEAGEEPTAILAAGTDTLDVALPSPGQRTFIQLEPRASAASDFRALSGVTRLVLDPVGHVVTWATEADEPTAAIGRVTVTLTDAGGFVDTTEKVRFRKTALGTTTDNAATSGPAGTTTTGTYTFEVTLDAKHQIMVEAYVTYTDGSTSEIGSWTFDRDKNANVVNLAASVTTNAAHVVANFDTDAVVGADTARYSFDDATWTTIDIAADRSATVDMTLTSAAQTVYVQGQNAAGAWGPSVSVVVPPYGPALSTELTLTTTQGIITWAGNGVECKVDSGSWGAPPPDDDGVISGNQITVARNAAGGAVKHYHFRSVIDGVEYFKHTVPVLPQEATNSSPYMTGVFALADIALDTLEIDGSLANPPDGTIDYDVSWAVTANGSGSGSATSVSSLPYTVSSGLALNSGAEGHVRIKAYRSETTSGMTTRQLVADSGDTVTTQFPT